MTMKIIITLFCLLPVLALCLVGACAALCGFKRIDAFCANALSDTDGQPES